MLAFLTKLVAGPLIIKLVELYKSYNEKKITEAALRRDIERVVLGTFEDVSKTQGHLIETEMKAESPLQRLWRPVTALIMVFVVFFYALLMPIMVGWFGWPPVRIGDELLRWVLDIVMVCLGGYIGGRSLEKIVAMLRK